MGPSAAGCGRARCAARRILHVLLKKLYGKTKSEVALLRDVSEEVQEVGTESLVKFKFWYKNANLCGLISSPNLPRSEVQKKTSFCFNESFKMVYCT